MIWIILALALLWLCVMALGVSLAVMAKRGDEAMKRQIGGPGVMEEERY